MVWTVLRRKLVGTKSLATAPVHVSQIFITDSSSKILSPALEKNVASVQSHFPDCQHTLYSGPELRDFIVQHFEPEVVVAYDSLTAYAAKADLGRYCLLYVLGGWYFDIGIDVIANYKPSEETQFLAFRDIQRHTLSTWACATSVLYAKPGSKFLDVGISMVVRNCSEKYYGLTPLCPTGPTVLGEALASFRAQPDCVFGDHLELTPSHSDKNRAFVLPDGKILAFTKRAEGGDLKALGAKGINNYNVLWHARKFYA